MRAGLKRFFAVLYILTSKTAGIIVEVSAGALKSGRKLLSGEDLPGV